MAFTRLTHIPGRGQTCLLAHKSIPRLGMKAAPSKQRQVRSNYCRFNIIMLINQAIRGIRMQDEELSILFFVKRERLAINLVCNGRRRGGGEDWNKNLVVSKASDVGGGGVWFLEFGLIKSFCLVATYTMEMLFLLAAACSRLMLVDAWSNSVASKYLCSKRPSPCTQPERENSSLYSGTSQIINLGFFCRGV